MSQHDGNNQKVGGGHHRRHMPSAAGSSGSGGGSGGGETSRSCRKLSSELKTVTTISGGPSWETRAMGVGESGEGLRDYAHHCTTR